MKRAFFAAVSMSALLISAADAGPLKARLTDVNTPGGGDEMDMNGNGNGGPGTLDGDTGDTTVDGDLFGTRTDGVALSPYVDYGSETLRAHFEVDLYEENGFGTFTDAVLVELFLSGDGVWKVDSNVAPYVRAGSDDVFSDVAVTLNGAGFQEGTQNRVAAVIEPNDEGPDENALGFVLPIRITDCGDVNLRARVTSDVPGGGTVVRETDLQLANCDNNRIQTSAMGFDVLTDFERMFTAFRVADGKGSAIADNALIGMVTHTIPSAVVNLKEKSAESPEDRFFDARDVQSYVLQLGFDAPEGAGLTGIRTVEMYTDQNRNDSCSTAILDRANNTATFTLTQAEFEDCFERFYDGDLGESTSESDTVFLGVTSFDDNDMLNAIPAQVVSITQNSFDFFPFAGSGTNQVALVDGDSPAVAPDGRDFTRIVRAGVNFGPFDWATDGRRTVNSFYRVTGYPQSVPSGERRATVIVENSNRGGNGACTFDVDASFGSDIQIPRDGKTPLEFLITPNRLQGILSNCLSGEDLSNFGRADLTFSWHLKEADAELMDMDRLLLTGGVFTSYGDNSNDAFSLKARSCDPGRFGPHTANLLSREGAETLTEICNFGALRNGGSAN